jgi:hypothetical protein
MKHGLSLVILEEDLELRLDANQDPNPIWSASWRNGGAAPTIGEEPWVT